MIHSRYTQKNVQFCVDIATNDLEKACSQAKQKQFVIKK